MMSIDSLLELIVERDSEITGRQIAEALWFMLAIKHSQESEADARGQPSAPYTTRAAPSLPSTIQQSEQPLPLMGQEETRSTPTINQPDLPVTISASEQSQADLYPLSAETSKETAAKITPLRVPSVGALPNAASIARALRPLRRRVPSRHRIRLDERVTAERSAEENTLVPVMLPAQSRWLALHLVVDQGGSATIWQDTIQELHRLLIRQGAFRDIRLWQFDSDSDDKELLLFAGRNSTIPRRASELSDPEGRHLVLIVSDCVGRAWHNGRATTALSLWSNSSPMALFQLMPPQLWDRTALGREIEVHLKASAAGVPNTRLIATPVDEWEDVLPTKNVLTPVVTLTTEAIKAWVNLLIGRPGSVVSGHALDRGAKSSHPNRPSDLTPSPSQRVQRFLSLSTPTAQRLALLASAAPVTLPILNLLCATFLPMADQGHVAELLLSGLLYRTSSDVSREPDAVLYEFYDGVRDLLLELAPFNQSSEVVARVSAYLEERAEHEREMRALLALPGVAGITNLPEALPFAHVRATLLRKLGYEQLAIVVEKVTVPLTDESKQSTDKYDTKRASEDISVNNDNAPSPSPSPLPQLKTYLRNVVGACTHLSLADADSSDPTRSAVSLLDVYVDLEVMETGTIGQTGLNSNSSKKQHRLTVLDVLAEEPRLVLLGSPGSGKTTALNFIALCLGRVCLGEFEQTERLGIDWSLGLLLPVRVQLRSLASWINTKPDASDHSDEALFWRFLEEVEGLATDQITAIRDEVTAGRALFLFDGLDEIPSGSSAINTVQFVIDMIQDLHKTYNKSRFIVSCRTLDYQEPLRQLIGWPTTTILTMTDEKRDKFIKEWYAVMIKLGRPMVGDPNFLAIQLINAFRERQVLRSLAGSPLLLTMIILLHTYEGRIPEERIRVYEKITDFLLYRWRSNRDTPFHELLGIASWRESDTQALVARMAFTAQERDIAFQSDNMVGLSRSELIETAARFFAPYSIEANYSRAQIFCNFVSQYSNGILEKSGPETFRFPHRIIQEYLAARCLVTDGGWEEDDQEFVERALRRTNTSSQWREVLLLAISQLVVINRQLRPAVSLVEELLVRHSQGTYAWLHDVLFAAEILIEIGHERLTRMGARYNNLWEQAAITLVKALQNPDGARNEKLSFDDRLRTGIVLGQLGDPRPGIGSLEPDWCEVPAGPFLLGTSEKSPEAKFDGTPQRLVTLPAFRIARYLVTNAQWNYFIEAGGYQERRWWNNIAWKAKEEENWTSPQFWADQRYNGLNQPVVGVSWHEVTAFCHWLSAQLNYEVRLPSEAEWEKTARGVDGRVYPWGDEWDSARSNTKESDSYCATAVGCFPDGVSPYGALDMSGNVLEWTATPWSSNFSQSDGTAITMEGVQDLVVRGGSWSLDRWNARCASRQRSLSLARDPNLGFRVIASLRMTD